MPSAFKLLFCFLGLPVLVAFGLWQALESTQTVRAGPSAPAVTNFVITTTNDSGPGSLRQAFLDANAGFLTSLITFNLAGCPCVISVLSQLSAFPAMTIQGPGAGLLAVDGGGSVRVFDFHNNATVRDLTIQNGASDQGAGGGIKAIFDLTLMNVVIRNNTAAVSMSDLGHGGGVNGAKLTAINTQFIGNVADHGGAMSLSGSAVLSNTLFLSNTANYYDGALEFGATVASSLQIANSEFRQNSAVYGGGAIGASGTSPLVMTTTNSLFIDNKTTATGGTILFAGDNLRLVNSLFAHNTTADPASSGTLMIGGNAQVLFTTFAQPITGSGSAVLVLTGTVGMTDTIVSSYTVGIRHAAPGTVQENYNLYFANGSNFQGVVITGANSLTGNPKFVNAAGGDYHLSSGSAAIDKGTGAGVTTDIDGQHRPLGAGFDIGFDEYINLANKLYLPLVRR